MLERIILKNGLKVLLEPVPDAKSLSVGVLIKSGTVYEKKEQMGISHFIEHLLFKGTGKYTQRILSEKFDDIGGRVNAYTGREVTYFYAHSLTEHGVEVLELLYDMIANSVFSKEDIEKEKSVIMDEIYGDNDDPEAILSDLLAETILAGTPYAGKILGTEETVLSMEQRILSDYYENRYVAENIILCMVGNFESNKMTSILNNTFGKIRSSRSGHPDHILFPSHFTFSKKQMTKLKNLDQIHMIFSFPGCSYHSSSVYSISLLSTLLGGSASSRLFQNIREAEGLVYDIDCYPIFYQKCGMLCINTAINVEKYEKTFDLLHQEIQSLNEHPPSQSELKRAKELLKTNIILDWENPLDRVEDYALHMDIYKKQLIIEEEIKKIDRVTLQDLNFWAKQMTDYSKMTVCSVHDPNLENKITEKIEEYFV